MPSEVSDIADALRPHGFRKRAGAIFTNELNPDVLGWLGLHRNGRGGPKGHFTLSPVVGLRHQPLERLVAELRGTDFHAYRPPTVNRPIGYLAPPDRYLSWHFGAPEDERSSEELVSHVLRVGLPFMKENASLRSILDLMESGYGFPHQLRYRRIVGWRMVGETSTSQAIIDEARESARGRSNSAAEGLLTFLSNVENLP